MSWTHLSDATPKAAKAYRCYLCGFHIWKGETHVKRTGAGDDGIDTTRMHTECEAVTHNWREDEWEGHDQWEFREELAEWREKREAGVGTQQGD